MELETQVQILDEAVGIAHQTKVSENGMNISVLSIPAKGK